MYQIKIYIQCQLLLVAKICLHGGNNPDSNVASQLNELYENNFSLLPKLAMSVNILYNK